jgi:hypothetical protein
MEQIFERILRIVDQHLCPSVKEYMFGLTDDNTKNDTTAANSLIELFHNNQLQFAKREPAINVYRPPFGHIGMHKDNFDLTVLIPLSSPEDDFTGGGTAFWHQAFPKNGMDDPAFILRPPGGTAVLFGGKVSHSGLQVRSGTRAVFVCSFSRPSSPSDTTESS